MKTLGTTSLNMTSTYNGFPAIFGINLTAKHDIQGAVRKSTREKRLMEFQADAREVINAATKDVHDLLRKNLRGIAKLESTAVVDSIMEGLGEEV
jgi:2-oxo-4-hydroxy-4-carboxy--5-ureidoimidazoline (OHCU) decarboxylase